VVGIPVELSAGVSRFLPLRHVIRGAARLALIGPTLSQAPPPRRAALLTGDDVPVPEPSANASLSLLFAAAPDEQHRPSRLSPIYVDLDHTALVSATVGTSMRTPRARGAGREQHPAVRPRWVAVVPRRPSCSRATRWRTSMTISLARRTRWKWSTAICACGSAALVPEA